MPNSVISLTKFNGLNLALDPRQHTAPTLLAGQNVLVDAEGVFAAFGADLISEAEIVEPHERTQTFRIGLDTAIFAHQVVLGYNQTAQRYYRRFEFTDANDYAYPWTIARVGIGYQFAKYGVGLVQYLPVPGSWEIISGGSVPTDIRFVTQCAGRLIAVTGDAVAWTAIDDPEDFTTSIATGAGAQSLAVIGKGEPLGVMNTKNGFIVFTETGAAFFDIVNSAIPFRFRPIETEELPINPWVIASLGLGRVVYLAEQGFRSINAGGEPEVFEPVMGEYLSKKILPFLDLSEPTIVSLQYSSKKQWLILSTATATDPELYTRSLVLYMANGQWGTFDEPHHQFGELYLADGPNKGINFGYFCDNGRFHRFGQYARRESTRLNGSTTYFNQLAVDPPSYSDGTITHFAAMARGAGFDISGFLATAGVYTAFSEFDTFAKSPANPNYVDETPTENVQFIDWNALTSSSDWNTFDGASDWLTGDLLTGFIASSVGWVSGILYYWAPTPGVYGSVNSIAEIGLIKFTDGQYGDTMSEINALTIGSNPRVQFDYYDWNTINGTHDWNTETGEEDWGSDFPAVNDFAVIFRGTLDGISVFNDNEKTPAASVSADSASFYNFNLKGIYHRFKLTALDTTSFFHLKTADITGSLAGRL